MRSLVTEIDAPRVAHLSITSACNWDCSFCSAHQSSGIFYPTETVCKVLERISDAGVATVVLYGGEPTLNPDYIKIGRHAKNLGLDVGIITNGSGIRKENIDDVLDIFSVAAISIHSFRRIHERITQTKGSFDPAIRALDLLTNEGLPTLENVTVTPLNLLNFDRFIKLLYRKYPSIMEFNVNRATFTGKGREYILNRGEVVEMVGRMAELKKEGVPVKPGVPIPPCILPSELRKFAAFCSAGTLFSDITGDGMVRPCSNVGQADILGNILENDLMELWNSERIVKLRNCDWIPENCKACELFTTCFCGCKRSPDGEWRIDPLVNEEYIEYYVANPHVRMIHVNGEEAIMSNKSSPILFANEDIENVKKTIKMVRNPQPLNNITKEIGISEEESKAITAELLKLGIIGKVYRKDLSKYNTADLFQVA